METQAVAAYMASEFNNQQDLAGERQKDPLHRSQRRSSRRSRRKADLLQRRVTALRLQEEVYEVV